MPLPYVCVCHGLKYIKWIVIKILKVVIFLIPGDATNQGDHNKLPTSTEISRVSSVKLYGGRFYALLG